MQGARLQEVVTLFSGQDISTAQTHRYAAALRQAGLWSVGPRGPYAPHLDNDEAAWFLLVAALGRLPRDCINAAQSIASLRHADGPSFARSKIFFGALKTVISDKEVAETVQEVRICCASEKAHAEIELKNGEVAFFGTKAGRPNIAKYVHIHGEFFSLMIQPMMDSSTRQKGKTQEDEIG